MVENCSHNCESCSENCSERTKDSLLEKPNEMSHIKKVIGVVSGKGGVGKSLVTSLLAVQAQRRGYKTAILDESLVTSLLAVLSRRKGYKTAIMDADITGPSIPRAFGLHGHAEASEWGLFPVKTAAGIGVMSLNLLMKNETDPVVWRGPLISGAVKQFWTDVIWGDVDYMFIDMPPGTGDVALTVFQSIPVDGIVIVASPQELVGMIVEKAVNMAKMMDVPVLALVENMSYITCPDCGKKIHVFGESHIDEIAQKHGVETVARMPIDPALAAACDAGTIESFNGAWLDGVLEKLTTENK